jgi:thiol:disulfide interchange protein
MWSAATYAELFMNRFRIMFWVGLLMAVGAVPPTFAAAAPPDPASVVKMTAVWRTPRAHAGGDNVLAVVLDIEPGWHINSDEANVVRGGDFQPISTVLTITAVGGLLAETPRFPKPTLVKVEFASGAVAVFAGQTVIYLPVHVPPAAPAGSVDVKLALKYQACDEKTCLQPTTIHATTRLEVVPAGEDLGATDAALFSQYQATPDLVRFSVFGWEFSLDPSGAGGLALMFLVAAVGGLLLNFTPCVLPVIPLKILSLSRAADTRGRCLALGVAMSIGVIAFWIALGSAVGSLALLKSTNELFQHPWFTVAVGCVIAVMAVGMCGLFAVRLPQWVYKINPGRDTLTGSAGFGVMTAVLSTPCTAPFMGAAAAWAAKQRPGVTLTVFAAIGLGMALPYLVLSAFPVLVKRMPRAGPASVLIKELMGLLMLAAAAYFIGTGVVGWTTTPPDPPTRAYWWVVMVFVAAAGLWLTWRTLKITSSAARRSLYAGTGVLLVAGAAWGGVRFTDRGPIQWVYYTPQRLAAAQATGKVVVLEFTAEWCLNCKALEEVVLRDRRVVAALHRPNVMPMKVDLTGNNEAGNQRLLEAGRNSIPWLEVLRPDGTVQFASEAYKPVQVVQAIERALSPR